MKHVREPAVIGAIIALVLLTVAALAHPLAWQMWAAWAVLTGLGITLVATGSQDQPPESSQPWR